jgi:predicted peptidase
MPAFAKRNEAGFLDRTVSVDGAEYKYQVFVPASWDKHKKWPELLFLHGAGERGDDGLLQTDVGIGHAIREHASRFEFIIVMPQCRKNHVWTEPEMETQALAALEQSMKEFNGDSNRVYLSGISMGGYGTWDMAARYPGKFAAFAPVCGGIRGLEDYPQIGVSLAKNPKVADPYAETAKRIGRTPVWVFHGAADDTVPVEGSRKMVEALRSAGGNVTYTEYPGVGHNSWDNAFAEPNFVPWLLSQSLRR